jgi:hypothetical protein
MKVQITLHDRNEIHIVEAISPLSGVIELLNKLGLNYRNERFSVTPISKQAKLKVVANA